MSLLEKLAEGWLSSLEDIESTAAAGAERDPGEQPCGRCGRDPIQLTQLERNILADLRRVMKRVQ